MDKYDKLRELKSLFDSGLLTETEFTNLKNETLFENSKIGNNKSETKQFIDNQSTSNKTNIDNTQPVIYTKPSIGVGHKMIIIIIGIVFTILGIKIAKPASNTTDNPDQVTDSSSVYNSNSNSTSQTEHYSEPEIKKCLECNGAGTIICKMCNGSGTNNMGMDCGCLSYNLNMIQLGRKTDPYSGPVHPCRTCRGTGIDSPREPEPMFNNE